MKKSVLLVLFLVLAAPVFAQGRTVTIISDALLNSNKQENKTTPSVKKLLSFVEQANQYSGNCVVFLGNNIKSANKTDLAMFSKITNRLKCPVFVTVGNSDLNKTRGLTHKEYYRILNKFSSNKISGLPAYKKQNDLVFVFLSGANETFSTYNGYYKADELEFLDKTLTKFTDKKIIIFQHFPVVPPTQDNMRQTHKASLYLDVLAAHANVLAVVSGHYNKEAVVEENGVKHISISGFGQTGEYEQIKIFKNKNGNYSITTKILNVE